MGSYKFNHWSKVGLITCSLLTLSLGETISGASASPAEASQKAFGLLKSGDQSYESGDFRAAVEQFREALSLTSGEEQPTTLTTELKDRYATAASQEAKRLAGIGRLDEAKALLSQALAYAPKNTYALRQQDYLNDPVKTNPSLTPEHVENTDAVRRVLYQAEGAYNLGKFDEAKELYNKVLRIDRYNKAARRGLERTAAATSDYYRSAYDATRAQLLADVDAAWELTPYETTKNAQLDTLEVMQLEDERSQVMIQQKMDAIMIPVIELVDADLYEAMDTLRELSRIYDTTTTNPTDKGVQFIGQFVDGAPELGRTFNLVLTNVPLSRVVSTLAESAGVQSRIDSYAVTFAPYGSSSDVLFTRTYTVSPGFLNAQVGNTSPSSNDPFASAPDSSGLMGRRLSAQQILESYGIKFPDGATASYIASTNTLLVKNSQAEHLVVSDLLDELAKKQPLQVAIEVKFIEVSQNNEKELGTDWSLTGTIADAIAGGSTGNGTSHTDLNGRPLTAGNRTGSIANAANNIADVIGREKGSVAEVLTSGILDDSLTSQSIIDSAGSATSIRNKLPAPGILSVLGSLDGATVEALMRGLDQKKGSDYVLKPSFVARSGQQTKVDSGREFIYPTEYEAPVISEGSATGVNDNIDDYGSGNGDEGGDERTPVYIFDDLGNLIAVSRYGQSLADQSPSVTPSHPTTFETVMLGTELDILPTVSEDGQTVNLDVSAIHREFEGFINYGVPIPGVSINISLPNTFDGDVTFEDDLQDDILNDDRDSDTYFVRGDLGPVAVNTRLYEASSNDILMPVFKTLSVDTNVTVYNGATVILGGLIEGVPVTVTDKTPILGNIPLLGKMFQSDVKHTQKKQIIIAITAKVIDSTGRQINN